MHPKSGEAKNHVGTARRLMTVATHDVCLDPTTSEGADAGDQAAGRTRERRRSKPDGDALDVLLTTLWVALVAGFAEGLYWLLRQQFTGAMVFMHPGFLWMSPLAQLTLAVVPGVLLATLAWLSNSARVLPFAATLAALVGWLNCLQLMVPGFHFWAWVVLAAGLAAATGRLFERHAAGCLKVVRCTTGWMVLLLVLVAFGQGFGAWRREASAVAAVPESPKKAPNLLLIVLDTVRADALRKNGVNRELAPNLAKIAEQGVRFNDAYSTAPWTLPSQAGMFTGRLPLELSADWLSRLDATHPTLAEELSARGWLTGGFVGNTRYCSAETGLGRGFCRYEGYRLSWADFALCTALGRKALSSYVPVRLGLHDSPGRKRAQEVTDSFLSWLNERRGRPFFAFLNYWDAHDPYFAPAKFRSHEAADISDTCLLRHWWWVQKEGLSSRQAAMLRTAYEDCIRGLDDQIGKLFERLETRGELKNTLIIVTADHGEHFGEHELFLHGNSLYEPLLHVPLILAWPGKIPAGVQVDAPVSLRSLPNTVCELLGQESEFPGSSWSRHWAAEPRESIQPEPIFAEIASQAGFPPCHGRSPIAAGAMQCVLVGTMKYIRNGDGSEELYDLATDRLEECNLARDRKYSNELEELRKELNAVQGSVPAARKSLARTSGN